MEKKPKSSNMLKLKKIDNFLLLGQKILLGRKIDLFGW